MPDTVINFSPDGSIRAIYDDDYDFEAVHGKSNITRAGIVDPITAGPNAGLWMVDMHLLGEGYEFCLWPPFPSRKIALDHEHQIVEKYVRTQANDEEKKQTAAASVFYLDTKDSRHESS